MGIEDVMAWANRLATYRAQMIQLYGPIWGHVVLHYNDLLGYQYSRARWEKRTGRQRKVARIISTIAGGIALGGLIRTLSPLGRIVAGAITSFMPEDMGALSLIPAVMSPWTTNVGRAITLAVTSEEGYEFGDIVGEWIGPALLHVGVYHTEGLIRVGAALFSTDEIQIRVGARSGAGPGVFGFDE
jgi:hypothetical protein